MKTHTQSTRAQATRKSSGCAHTTDVPDELCHRLRTLYPKAILRHVQLSHRAYLHDSRRHAIGQSVTSHVPTQQTWYSGTRTSCRIRTVACSRSGAVALQVRGAYRLSVSAGKKARTHPQLFKMTRLSLLQYWSPCRSALRSQQQVSMRCDWRS